MDIHLYHGLSVGSKLMSKPNRVIAPHPDSRHIDGRSYTIGFVLSITLTILPFLLVVSDVLTGPGRIAILLFCAIAQLAVQLRYFIHLGYDPKPRWNRLAIAFTVLVVFIVVVGSLWIMNNLDYNMMPHEVEKQIQIEEGFNH